jgi:hypothetical protein
MQKCASQPHNTTPQSQHRRTSLRYPEREESIMSSTPTEFHKIWIDQCEAAEGIRENFGSLKALDYLIGEKLCSYLMAAESDALFSAEVPAYVAEIRRLFTAEEIHDYLNCLERTKYLASPEPELESTLDADDEELWLDSPVRGAEELLRFSRLRQLLQE